MWLFFGLLAAMAAASMADMVVATGADEDEEDGSEARSVSDAEGFGLQGLNSGEWFHETPEFDGLDTAHSSGMADISAPHTGTEFEDSGLEAETAAAHDMAAQDLSVASQADVPQPESPGSSRMTAGADPEMGLFDHLDERIHSSDLYPAAQPPQPVLQQAGAEGAVLRGTVADDTLIGGAGNDTLIGAGGNNLLRADAGDNLLRGGEGDDWLIGGSGNDTLEGGWGNDLLIAGAGANVLMGGAGNDTLVGAYLDASGQDLSGANFLNGGGGDDLLIAGQGDVLTGGEGADDFALGDWLLGRAPAMIMDYTPTEDRIVLHYDPARLAAPELSVTASPSQPHMADIWLNGHVIAHIANAQGLRAEDILLVADHPAAMSLAAE
jgi:hypothetical protein